ANVMVAHTTRMLDSWQTDQPFDLTREMMALTLGIVTKTLFDADVSDDADAIGHAITLGLEKFNNKVSRRPMLPEWIPTAKNVERRDASALMETTIARIINDRRQSGEDKGDLLSMLLTANDEDGGRMTDKQIRDEAMTLFI